VRIHRQRSGPDWNTYALLAIIELARTRKGNPELPVWLEKNYLQAIQELAEIGLAEFDRPVSRGDPCDSFYTRH
jgi:hypothetical protein